MSLIPKVVLDKVSDVSLATYHPKDTKLFSFPLAAFSILRDTFHQTADFIFLDIGGEVADVFVVKGGLILQTASFPAGKHFIIRHLADNLAVTYMQAESMMNLHLEGHGSKEHAAHMDLVLENASREWTKIFHETIIKASDVVSLPRKLFVLVDGPLVGFFLKSLKEEKVAQFGVTETPFEVTLVTSDSFKGGVSFANRTHRDSSLALIAAFVGRKK